MRRNSHTWVVSNVLSVVISCVDWHVLGCSSPAGRDACFKVLCGALIELECFQLESFTCENSSEHDIE